MNYQGFVAKNNVKDLIKFKRFKQSELIWQAVNIFENNRGKLWNDVIQQDVLSQIDALQTIDQDAGIFYKDNGNMWIRLKKDAKFYWSHNLYKWDTLQLIIYASSDTQKEITLTIGGFPKVKIKIIYESYDIYNNKQTFSTLNLQIGQDYNPTLSNRPNIVDLEVEHYFKSTQNQFTLPISSIDTWSAGINVKHKYIFCETIDYQIPLPTDRTPKQTINYTIEVLASTFKFTQEYLNKQITNLVNQSKVSITYKYDFSNCLVYHDINNYEMKGNTTQNFVGSSVKLKFVTEQPGDITWWTGNLKDSLPELNQGWSVSGNSILLILFDVFGSPSGGETIEFGNPLLSDNPQPIINMSDGLRPYINAEVSSIDKNYNFKIRIHKPTGGDLFAVRYQVNNLLQMNLATQQYLILSDTYKDSIIASSEYDHFGTKSDLGFTVTKLDNCLLRCLFLNPIDTTNKSQIRKIQDFSQKMQCNSLDTIIIQEDMNIIKQQIEYDKPLPNYQNTYQKIIHKDAKSYTVNCDNYLIEAARRSSVNTISSLVNRVLSNNAMETLLDNVKATIIGGQNLTAITNHSEDNLPHSLQYALSANEVVLGANELKNIDITNDYLLVLRDDIDWQGVQFTKNGPIYQNESFLLNTMENFFVLAKTEDEEYVVLSILQNNVCPTVFSNARRILYTEGAYNFVRAFQIWQAQSMNITNQTFKTVNLNNLSSSSGSWQFTDLTLKFTNTSFIIL